MDVTSEYPLSVIPASREQRAFLSDALFESLFKENYSRLVDVLARITGNRQQAEELTTEAFWRLHSQPPPAERRENLAGWLFRTATHLGIDALRASNRRVRYEREAGQVSAGSAVPSPLDQMILDERRHRVRATLARMKQNRAQILMLRAGGFSYKEIAETFGIKTGSVGTLLARAEEEFEALYVNAFGKEER